MWKLLHRQFYCYCTCLMKSVFLSFKVILAHFRNLPLRKTVSNQHFITDQNSEFNVFVLLIREHPLFFKLY